MPLTQQQTKELGKMINERRSVLISELREDAERTREQPYAEHAGPAPDSGDESVATLFADLEQADVTRDLDEFRGIEAARQRLQDGAYGICADCGTDIDFSRLRAFPAALRCVQCQERYEKTYRGDPKPSL